LYGLQGRHGRQYGERSGWVVEAEFAVERFAVAPVASCPDGGREWARRVLIEGMQVEAGS
jgi:hypothetical protein